MNRIFSPIFGISFRTRGGYNFVMPTSLFELLLNESLDPEKIAMWRKTNSVSPKKSKIIEELDSSQFSLFKESGHE